MRVPPLGLAAHRGQHVARPVHRVIGRGRDVGPVRLDVRQVQHPGPVAGLAHEVDGAIGGVGRLAVRLGHGRGQPGPAHLPAAADLAARAAARIGEVVPGVVRCIAALAQPVAVGVAADLEARRPDAVVARIGLEAAVHREQARALRDVQAQARRAFGVGLHVRLADQRAAHAVRAQMVAERLLAHRQRHEVPHRAVAAHVAPGVGRHARGAADRALHEGSVEAQAARGERVDVRRVQARVAIAGQVVGAQLVAHDEQHVAQRPGGRTAHADLSGCVEKGPAAGTRAPRGTRCARTRCPSPDRGGSRPAARCRGSWRRPACPRTSPCRR